MEYDVNALQQLGEEEPLVGLFPPTCDMTCPPWKTMPTCTATGRFE